VTTATATTSLGWNVESTRLSGSTAFPHVDGRDGIGLVIRGSEIPLCLSSRTGKPGADYRSAATRERRACAAGASSRATASFSAASTSSSSTVERPAEQRADDRARRRTGEWRLWWSPRRRISKTVAPMPRPARDRRKMAFEHRCWLGTSTPSRFTAPLKVHASRPHTRRDRLIPRGSARCSARRAASSPHLSSCSAPS
jgi:hypothetical protein